MSINIDLYLNCIRINETENRMQSELEYPGDSIPEVRLLWTTGKAGVKVNLTLYQCDALYHIF